MKVAKLGLMLLVSSVCGAGCSPDYTNYYFDGRVYDGAHGTRVTDYKVQLQFLDRRIDGQVDNDGRYFVGPLTPFNDYTVEIRADGFRSFLSHNVMKVNDDLTNNNNTRDDGDHPDVSQYFDAYLFPTSVTTSPLTVLVSLSDKPDAPSGTIRLRPTTSSSLFETLVDTPAGVDRQVWQNDDDLQFATITRDFTNGQITFAPGDLVYGVTYAVTIFGVTGHAQLDGAFTAGFDDGPNFIVSPLGKSPLLVSFVSTQLGTPVASGEVVFVFNQPIELDPLSSADIEVRVLEQNFSIDSPDANANGTQNKLRPYDPTAPASALGLTATVASNKLTVKWSSAQALATTDAADPIRSVTYGGLDMFTIRPLGGGANDTVSIGTLLGMNSITVPVTP